MAKATATPRWQRALIVLTGTVVAVVVISCLYWAQTVLVPVALAVFLTFLLTPLVSFLQRRGLWRTPAVILVVLLAGLILGGVVWLVSAEVTNVVRELPKYNANITGKVKSLRDMVQGTEGLEKLFQDITGQWNAPQPGPAGGAKDEPAEPTGAVPDKPSSVVLRPDTPGWLAGLPALVRPIVELLGGLALALVLVVFMLLNRESLRNRLIRLVGHGRMTATTKALDDAGQRVSRYLLMQLIINASFGIVLAVGLLAIQVPHALLWGFLAAILRYVPYLGSLITAALLVTLSLAVFPSWWQPLVVVGLILGLELVTGNLVEPRLFGRSMGVSEVALLVAAAFWAFLWGPIGLVLSSPLTVCLVVLGKHVPQLEFLDVILGDEPSLTPDISYYQRLLARDQDEATQLILAQAKTSTPEQVYDAVLVPVLNYVKRDRARDDLTEADEQFILGATQEIVEDLGTRLAAAAGPAEAQTEPPPPRIRVVGCPAHDDSDALALEMLRQLLDPARWDMEVLSTEMLSAELVRAVGEKAPAVLCIGALPPGGLARTRYLCKRLRARLPNAKIVVGRWGLTDGVEQNQEQLLEAGADKVETTLLETQTNLNTWLPVLGHEEAKTVGNGTAADVRATLQPVTGRAKDGDGNRPRSE